MACPDTTCAEPEDYSSYYDLPSSYSSYDTHFDDSTYSIVWQLQSDQRNVKMSITSPDTTQRVIANQRCIIYALLENHGQYSNSFLLTEPCLTCEQSEIYDDENTTPFLTGFSNVAVGATGVQLTWTAFKHTA